MESRKITVFDSQTSVKDAYESSASTWGEFVKEIGRDFSAKKVTLQSNRSVLEDEEALLPEGDQTIFLFQKESKFGDDEDTSTAVARVEQIVAELKKINKKLKVLSKIKKLLSEAEDLDALAKTAREMQEKTSG